MPKAKSIGLDDDDVMQVIERLTKEDGKAVSVARITEGVGSYTGVFYTTGQVRVRVSHLQNQGKIEIIVGPLKQNTSSWFVRPKGTEYELPNVDKSFGPAPIRRTEVIRAKKSVRIGDSFIIRTSDMSDINDLKPIEKTVSVVKKLPHLCLFDDGTTVQWWQIAAMLRRDITHRVLDLY